MAQAISFHGMWMSVFLLTFEIFLSSQSGRRKQKKKNNNNDIVLALANLLFNDGCLPSRKKRMLLGLIH